MQRLRTGTYIPVQVPEQKRQVDQEDDEMVPCVMIVHSALCPFGGQVKAGSVWCAQVEQEAHATRRPRSTSLAPWWDWGGTKVHFSERFLLAAVPGLLPSAQQGGLEGTPPCTSENDPHGMPISVNFLCPP